MDQLIYASLSHTHYWYEVGMLKVPECRCVMQCHSGHLFFLFSLLYGRPGGSVGNLETSSRWDVSSNLGAVTRTGIFPRENKNKNHDQQKWRTIRSWVHKFNFMVGEGKGRLNLSRDKKLRQAPQKEGGTILCDLPPV